MTTIADVARAAGVSKATASRVLSGRRPGVVTPETTDRVRTAAESLGYRAHPIATALATGRTGVLALWMRNVYRPFFAELMHHVSDQARSHGLDLIMVERARSPVSEDAFVPSGTGWPVDGILAHEPPGVLAGRPTGEWPRVPVVVMCASPFEGADVVRFDLHGGALAAMRHIAEQGCRRIGYLAPGIVLGQRQERSAAYHAVIHEAGLPYLPIATANDAESFDGGWAAVSHYLGGGGEIDGLFCHNDELAFGALRALRDNGLRVPEDVAVTGCDDIAMAAYTDPPLTTIRIPIREIVCAASEMLIRRIADPSGPYMSKAFATRLVVRRSSQHARPESPRDTQTPQEKETCTDAHSP